MHQAVILLHTLPDGTSHFDWMIDQPERSMEHRLITYRCNVRPDSKDSGSFSGERIPDHRVHYLTFEGKLSQNRGTIERLANGQVLNLIQTPNTIHLDIKWNDRTISYQAQTDENHPENWNFLGTEPDS